MIDEYLLTRFRFDTGKTYTFPGFSSLENGNLVFVGDTLLSTSEDFDTFLEQANKIGNGLLEKYGEELEELFYLNLNRYIALANKYVIASGYLRVDSYLTSGSSISYSLEDIKRTIEFLVDGLYQIHRIVLSNENLSFDISDGEVLKEEYAIIPYFNNRGVLLKRNEDVLEVVFHSAPLSVFDNLLEQIKSIGLNSVQYQQIQAQINKLRKDSAALALKFIYQTDDLKDALNKMSYDWKMLIGVDLSQIE